jgi:hypothetical protein
MSELTVTESYDRASINIHVQAESVNKAVIELIRRRMSTSASQICFLDGYLVGQTHSNSIYCLHSLSERHHYVTRPFNNLAQ